MGNQMSKADRYAIVIAYRHLCLLIVQWGWDYVLCVLLPIVTMSSKTKCVYPFLPSACWRITQKTLRRSCGSSCSVHPLKKTKTRSQKVGHFFVLCCYHDSLVRSSLPEIVEIESPAKSGSPPKKGETGKMFVSMSFFFPHVAFLIYIQCFTWQKIRNLTHKKSDCQKVCTDT